MTHHLRRSDLRLEQQTIAQLCRDHRALMIVATMGSGKTGAILTVLRDLLDELAVRRVLVIAPLRVARDTWPAEVETWEHTRVLSVAVACGTPKERAAAVDGAAEIVVTNFESIVWLYNHVGGARGWPFDAVVVDESSAFKAGKKRTTASKRKTTSGRRVVTKGGRITRFGALAQVRNRIRRVVLLTGTPAPRGVHDLWGQVYIIDQGVRLGSTITAFEDRWFNKNAYSYEVTPKQGAESEIVSRIRDVVFEIPPPADLPQPVFVPVPVHLPRAALDEYVRFKKTLFSEAHDVEAVSRGVLTNKLLQFANGSMYREDGTIAAIHNAKIEALEDLIARASGDPLLVLYSFKFDLAEIRRIYPKVVCLNEGTDVVKRWNDGKIKLLAAHPKSCAHGLNLQFGGHLGVWYGLTWSLELYQQANARLARPGQKWPVAMYQILAEGTDDCRVLSVLDSRDATQESITKAVRKSIYDAHGGS